MKRTLMTAMLVAASALTVLPQAAAHGCAASDGCDARSCVAGEDHDHTDYNTHGPDEYCHSEVVHDDEPPCRTPRVLGICVVGGGVPQLANLGAKRLV